MHALRHLVWDINQRAVEHTPGCLLHASGAARNGQAVLFPATPDSGKSTTVTALLRAGGWSYLSDEIIPLSQDATHVGAYPRAISLDPGSFPLFPDLAPEPDPSLPGLEALQWFLDPATLGDGAVARDGATPAVIVFPSYQPDVPSTPEPVSPGKALLEVAQSTFTFERDPKGTFEALTNLVERCPAYRVGTSDLDAATAAIADLVEANG